MMEFAPGCFLWPTFWRGFPWSQLLQNLRKCAMEGSLSNLAIARLYGHFGSRGLQQNVVLCLLFKCILIKR